jgi:putative endonuclease
MADSGPRARPRSSGPDRRRLTGRRGEAVAAAYLVGQGYEILARNVRTRYGEIDVVAREGETLVFIEVRARRGSDLGTPEESIDARKQARLVALSEAYLADLAEPPAACRIDVVAVELSGSTVRRIDLIRDAVQS